MAAHAFAPLIADVATELLGKPDQTIGNGSTLRWGSRGSFKVDTAEGVWHDKEANKGGGVLDLIMRELGCDKAGALGWMEGKGLIEPRDAGRTFYDYTDEAGAVLFRVERGGSGAGQRFVQHGPDGRGGFVCRKGCMAGVRRVLYRLPDIVRADPAEPVFVCEGEKDADRLARLDLVATTNPGGALKFLSDLAPPLRGRRVIVLQDNDSAGREHAADVAKKLKGVAAAVAILALDGLPEKGDVSDWLDAGGTVDRLRELAAAAIEVSRQNDVKPDGPAGPAFKRGISAAALMAKQFAPINYVVPGLLAEGATLQVMDGLRLRACHRQRTTRVRFHPDHSG
jgi:hypothetical protein